MRSSKCQGRYLIFYAECGSSQTLLECLHCRHVGPQWRTEMETCIIYVCIQTHTHTHTHTRLYIYNVSYSVYLKCLNKLQEWVHPHQSNENFHINTVYVRKHFSGYSPTFARPQSFIFSSVETPKTPDVFVSNWKWRYTAQRVFCVLPFATAPGPSKRVRQSVVRRWYGWMTFWAFAANCDLINCKNSTVTKLGTCSVDVLRQIIASLWYLLLNAIFNPLKTKRICFI
jgi:hypothetical protein